LKTETFKFLNRPDIGNNVQKWREIILEDQQNDEESEEYDDDNSELVEEEKLNHIKI